MSSLLLSANRRMAAAGCMAIIIAGCGHEPVRRLPEFDSGASTTVSPARQRRKSVGETAAVVAVRQIGVPYRYGGSSVKGFDCSGLVHYAYARAGTRIPRTTAEQWRQLTPIAGNNLRVGDLLFFRIDGRISHVGLYLGDGRFVHAPSSGREVTVADLDSAFYRETFVRAARPSLSSD